MIVALPMHGEVKFVSEGLRTRDGHVIHWLQRLLDEPLLVYSRPEPWPRLSLARARARSAPSELDGATLVSPQVLALPSLRQRRAWWTTSRRWYPAIPADVRAVLTWSPPSYLAVDGAPAHVPVHFDLLDDWLAHPLFAGQRRELEHAYGRMFERATSVTANSESTLELARRFGRDDARLLLNGCDPDTFSAVSLAAGPTTVGYAGKLGFRLDVESFVRTARRLASWRFVVAGPIMEKSAVRALWREPNVEHVGDVHPRDYPGLLRTWDLGWVPHRTGAGGEVGGDVLKIYEFRAAGLPTVVTPIIGADRALPGVRVAPPEELAATLASIADGRARVPREPFAVPDDMTWEAKTRQILATLGASP